MENVPPAAAMNRDALPNLEDLLRPKRNVKSSRQSKRSAALNSRTNADHEDESSGLLTPPSSTSQDQEQNMDPARMLFSPPPEEVLRSSRHSTRARSEQPPFTPSLLADPPAASSKRKRNAHNRSSSHSALETIVKDPPATSVVVTEATPNPKPRKQSKHGSPSRGTVDMADAEPTTPTRTSSRRSESPSKRTLYRSPHHSNPSADYIPPLLSVSRETLSSRRRSATPIPPYEPPRERFTPPREIVHTPPGASRSPDGGMSKSSKRKSTAPRNRKKLVIAIKKEPPEIDLSAPAPPASPSDDPLLLKGLTPPPRRQRSQPPQVENAIMTPSYSRQTPSVASSSPVSPADAARGGRIPDLNSSMDLSMQDDDSMDEGWDAGPPLFNFNAPEDSGVWDDDDDDSEDEFDQTGEYTGRFKAFVVPTKADPPSSCTRSRQDAWGNPSSPFPGGRRRTLPSSSSPPLRALSEGEDGTGPSTSFDDEDVFFLDTPVDTTIRPEFEEGSSRDILQDILDEDDHSLEIHEAIEETLGRSPSPIPIVDAAQSELAGQSTEHHVRFTNPDAENDDSMEVEDDSFDAQVHTSLPPAEHQAEDDNPFPDEASDSGDEQTVDRELSREPGHLSDSEEEDQDTRPHPPTIPTPTRAVTPGRSLSPQAGPSRPRGFLSITSPLRRQKSPRIPGRDESPMPSIAEVFAVPAQAPSHQSAADSPESTGSRVRTETSEETVVGEHMDEDDAVPKGSVATDVEDGSGDESEDLDADVVKITSGDPRVAARAAAILKMHDYDFIVRDTTRKRRHSSVDSVLRKVRRKSVLDGGITKSGTPVHRRRTLGGVIGDKVFIPGSPLMTVPQLLHEAELSVEQRERGLRTPSRIGSESASFKLPLPVDRSAFETPGPRQRVHARPMFDSAGPRAWEKDDWKLLDACFTDERIARGGHKQLGEATLAPVEEVVLENVVNRFLDFTANVPVDECWPGWTREDLLRRTQALQRKQRSGKVAPPTPSGRFSSVALSEVPDFTPLPSRQSSVQPGLNRQGSTSSMQSNKPLPASLLAPRYSHLLEEAIAVSRNEASTLSASGSHPVEYRSSSVPAPDQRSFSLPPPSLATDALRAESEAPGAADTSLPIIIPPPLAERSIAARMKGFFWSYLPRATKPSSSQPPKRGPAHPGLPIPPPEVFAKPRGPIATPVRQPSERPVHPKELVSLQHAPLPPPKPSLIPRPKPKRLVELHPAPPPEERPRSSLGSVSDRRSSSGSVKDLVRGFEHLEKEQERERVEEAMRVRRVRSVGEWAATSGLRAQAQAQGQKPGWKP